MIDPITDDDLIAFVDGQIDPMRRLDVEAHLAANPAAAARVMAEMHDRDALRACFERVPGPGPDRNMVLARRFDRNLRWRRVASRLKRAAAIAVLVGAGWLAHDEIGRFGVPDTLAATPDPALIADARQARVVAQLRKSIGGQADDPVYDRARLRSATGIDLPALPDGWRVRDIQVFPARHGHRDRGRPRDRPLRRGVAVRHPRHPRRTHDAHHRLGRRRRRLVERRRHRLRPERSAQRRGPAAGGEPPRRRSGEPLRPRRTPARGLDRAPRRVPKIGHAGRGSSTGPSRGR